ncbi:hypothetical protein GC174_12020 [bacterium]|nr:hypothetical protein [bacterium]
MSCHFKTGTLLTSVLALALVGTAPAKGADSTKAKKPVHREHIPTTTGAQIPFKQNSAGSIAFSAPSAWQAKEKDDENMMVKLGGDIAGSGSGEMSISRHVGEGKTSAEDLKELINRFFLAKLPNHKIIQEKKIFFGSSRKIEGILEDAYLDVNGAPIFQRIIFFEDPDGKTAYTLNFISTRDKIATMTPVFNRILLSVNFKGASQSASYKSAAATKAVKKDTVSLNARYAPIAIDYPRGWKVEENTGDNPIAIEGKNAAGKTANISVHKGPMHPYWSIEDVANSLEKEHMTPHQAYHRVNRSPKTFGSGSAGGIQGIVQESTFKDDKSGAEIKQMTAYFNDDKNVYVLTMSSTDWKASDMHQAFHKILASLRLKDKQ